MYTIYKCVFTSDVFADINLFKYNAGHFFFMTFVMFSIWRITVTQCCWGLVEGEPKMKALISNIIQFCLDEKKARCKNPKPKKSFNKRMPLLLRYTKP